MKTLSSSLLTLLILFCSVAASQTLDISNTHNTIQRIYQENGSLLEIRTLLLWNNDQWENSWRNIYSYDAENKLIEELDQGWNNNMWNDVFHGYYYYDTNNNLIEFLTRSSAGINFLRYLYSYDANNNRIERIRQMWNVNVWENDGRVLYAYNANNDPTEEIAQEWDGFEWINEKKYTYSYLLSEAENIEAAVFSYNISNNFPNPFNPSTKIKYCIPVLSYVTIKVFNAVGKEVAVLVNEEKPAGRYEIEFDATDFPSGVYLYQLKAGNFIESKKMVLIK
jgi:hypothetical protein